MYAVLLALLNATPRCCCAFTGRRGTDIIFGLDKLVRVSDTRIVRLLSAIGAVGNILSSYGEGRKKISVVLWDHNAAA